MAAVRAAKRIIFGCSLSEPAGLAPDIVESANREVVKALQRPQMKRQIE